MKKIKNQAHEFPDFNLLKKDNINYNQNITKAINYANYVFDLEDLKKETFKYTDDLPRSIPLYEFHHVGKLCWLYNNNGDIDVEDLNQKILNLKLKYTNKNTSSTPKLVVEIPKKQNNEVLSKFQETLDVILFKDLKSDYKSLLHFLKSSSEDSEIVKKSVKRQLEEISNPENREYFDGWSLKERKRIIEIFEYIISITGTSSSIHTPRANPVITRKRVIKPSKMVNKVKYLREFKELQLKSVHPEKIVFAKGVWLYNVKTRKLQQYVAASDKGLLVKGTTILNYDEKLSSCKNLRKPQEVITKLLACSKVEQRKFMDTINAVGSPLKGRINSDCIILRVV